MNIRFFKLKFCIYLNQVVPHLTFKHTLMPPCSTNTTLSKNFPYKFITRLAYFNS